MNRKFVIFGLAEWTAPLPTNQHHLARQLARRGYEVLFVDTVGTRKPRLTLGDMGRVAQRIVSGSKGAAQAEPGIWRISPLGPPPGTGDLQRNMLQRRYATKVAQALEQLGWNRPIGWFFNPRAAFVLDSLDFSRVVFHLVDDLRVIPGADAAEIEMGEKALAQRAEHVLASAPPLLERLQAMAPRKTHYLPNVADFEHFHRASGAEDVPARMQSIARPRIVFSGNLTASKLDLDLIVRMVRDRAEWQWVFIGPRWEGEDEANLAAFSALPNAHFPGHVAYEALPSYLAGADALVIPYRTDAATESVCPLKFFEYLATGKPVVATPLPALREFGEVAPLADTPEAFLGELEFVMRNDSAQSREGRLALARKFTWERRMEEIEALLEGGDA